MRIIITINKGVANVMHKPKGVELEIIDFDVTPEDPEDNCAVSFWDKDDVVKS